MPRTTPIKSTPLLVIALGKRCSPDLAAIAGVRPDTVSRWFSGRQRPSPSAARRLEDTLGLSAAQLFAPIETQ